MNLAREIELEIHFLRPPSSWNQSSSKDIKWSSGYGLRSVCSFQPKFSTLVSKAQLLSHAIKNPLLPPPQPPDRPLFPPPKSTPPTTSTSTNHDPSSPTEIDPPDSILIKKI